MEFMRSCDAIARLSSETIEEGRYGGLGVCIRYLSDVTCMESDCVESCIFLRKKNVKN